MLFAMDPVIGVPALDRVANDRLGSMIGDGDRVVAHEVALVLDRDDFAEMREDGGARLHRRCVGEFEIAACVVGTHDELWC